MRSFSRARWAMRASYSLMLSSSLRNSSPSRQSSRRKSLSRPFSPSSSSSGMVAQSRQGSGKYNAEFTEQAAYLIAECRARLDEPGANSVFRLHHLLLHALNLNKAHAGTAYGFTDRFGIIRVVLAALDVGLDELWRHQACLVSHLTQLTRPVVGTTAGFHADQGRSQLAEVRQHLTAS